MPGGDVLAYQLTNEESDVGAPPLDALRVSLSTSQVCSSDLLPGHAVSVAHKESAVLVPLETASDSSSTSEPQENPPFALSGPTTSAAALVSSQARGQLLLLQMYQQCAQDKIRTRCKASLCAESPMPHNGLKISPRSRTPLVYLNLSDFRIVNKGDFVARVIYSITSIKSSTGPNTRMLHAKRNSSLTRSASASRELRLLTRRRKSGTMKDYQLHLVVSGQVLNLAIVHTLSSRQPPEFSGTPWLRGYSPGLQTIPELRRKHRERR
ncbi:hypothetical protein RhiJN_20911 [Ceratobasidium sp. AG-Ba]|nr:hypothetical protein RhiJN_20911 [Ceratobasidium sp. AG-Ba]